MKATITFITVIAALATSIVFARTTKEVDIVETAVTSKKFPTLVAAIQAAGLAEALSGKGPFTVFAPTEEAFKKLPAGTLDSLLKPENKEKLIAILKYHVIPGKVTASEVVKLKNGTHVKTLSGQTITVKNRKGVMVNNAKVVKTDITASNGVIHVIDTVLLPK